MDCSMCIFKPFKSCSANKSIKSSADCHTVWCTTPADAIETAWGALSVSPCYCPAQPPLSCHIGGLHRSSSFICQLRDDVKVGMLVMEH